MKTRGIAWVKRYAPLEVVATTSALAGALITHWLTGNGAAAALAGAVCESIGFYSFAFVRSFKLHFRALIGKRKASRIWRSSLFSIRDISLEFGVAEVVDTFLVRSPLMYAIPLLIGNFTAGILVGKVLADVVFYGIAALSYTASRRFIEPASTPAPTAPVETVITSGAPLLRINLATVGRNYETMVEALPDARIHYAMKCNPHPRMLEYLHDRGCSFEVASLTELLDLHAIGVDVADVLFSNPVKMTEHIAGAYELGLRRFAFDSDDELQKISEYAPGSSVYVRLHAERDGNTVPSEGKFGVDPEAAALLLWRAQALGLDPYGISFHVGSQMLDVRAWDSAIEDAAWVMSELLMHDIKIKMLNIGGGFPAYYGEAVPSMYEFGEAIFKALEANLPYDVRIVAEPGRSLVADAGVISAQVVGVANRRGRRWAHLNIGAFNGMMESLETANELGYPMTDSRESEAVEYFHVTGPSCDSQDTIRFEVPLSANLQTGDTVYIGSTGAYTTSYASTFNGFSIPDVIFD